jgi:cytochrome c-type biogenesis protein CcmH/NrfF
MKIPLWTLPVVLALVLPIIWANYNQSAFPELERNRIEAERRADKLEEVLRNPK